MFTVTFAVTAMMCCVLVHGGGSEELTKISVDLVQIMSGYYDNQKQIDKGYTDNDFIQDWFIPVHLSMFGSKLVLLFMEARDGVSERLQLHVVSSSKGKVVKMTPYNFTDPSLYKPGEFSLKDLGNLTLNQLHTDPDCVITYDLVRPGVFMAKWPVCELIVEQIHPRYAITFTCDEIFAVTPIGAKERQGRALYDVNRKGDKYTLVIAPENYVGPCDKQV